MINEIEPILYPFGSLNNTFRRSLEGESFVLFLFSVFLTLANIETNVIKIIIAKFSYKKIMRDTTESFRLTYCHCSKDTFRIN